MLARLKELRHKKGISQQILAEEVGVSQQSVNKYENQAVEPDIRTMIAIADYFNTSVDYLIGHTEISSRIEKTSPCDLNKEEEEFLSKWRKLDQEEKDSLSSVVQNYLRRK